MSQTDAASWSAEIFSALLRHRIRQVAYVPDAGHRHLIDLCRRSEAMIAVPLTTEEEGVALLAGAWLGGERGVLLMQSSGVGNCLNLFSLPRVCGMPLLILVTMRGEEQETNPWQVPMGRGAAQLLNTAGIETFVADDGARVADTVESALHEVFGRGMAAAVLISQRVIGFKQFEE